jgi:HEAT repeat protein
LCNIGDTSGYATLLAIVQSQDPIPGQEPDIRIRAAVLLAQYGQASATQDIYNLYQSTHNGELMVALVALGAPQAATLAESRGFYSDSYSLIFYGQAGTAGFIPQITAAFQNTTNAAAKIAAAWALATMTGDQTAVNYLVQTAQDTLSAKGSSISHESVIKDLGSIQDPQVKPVLESALQSTDPTVVQTAIVNLIYNQGSSDKAVQVIANQLNGSTPPTLPTDFVLNMANQLQDNPQIQRAGAIFAQHDASGFWQLYTVERKNWPVANWIGNYVVKLNRK